MTGLCPFAEERDAGCVVFTLEAAGREVVHLKDVLPSAPHRTYQSLAQALEADFCFRSAMRPQPFISISEGQRVHHAEQHVP